jgi:hypothetical protein
VQLRSTSRRSRYGCVTIVSDTVASVKILCRLTRSSGVDTQTTYADPLSEQHLAAQAALKFSFIFWTENV